MLEKRVVYWVPDLMFGSKIREAAQQTGVTVESVRQLDALLTSAVGAALVVLDLRAPTALEALDRLAADPALSPIKKVGFIDHERLDVIEQARARGCSEVFSKGKFSSDVAKLFAAL